MVTILPTAKHNLDELKKLTEIDEKIGLAIRKFRNGRGMSQIELGEKIGVSFQQVQKYEKGMTRMSVLRLGQIAEALGVPINVFFEEEAPPAVSGGEDIPAAFPLLADKEEILFTKLFRRVKNKKIREGLLRQLRGIVELEEKR